MKHVKYFLFTVLLIPLIGCQTAKEPNVQPEENLESTLSSVVGAVSGKEVTEEEWKNLKKQIRKDPEAQSAIETISESYSTEKRIVKYCPLTGKRYAAHIELCPEHDIKLKIVGQ